MRLHELGWGAKRLSKEFGCARNTVRRYLREGGAAPFKKPVRRSAFDGLDDWLRERFFRHAGNADVIRQELASEHGITIGLRSVELRVREWRRELKAQKRATVRFETPPGRQLQIDFGQTRVWIGDERIRVNIFVVFADATLLSFAAPMQFPDSWIRVQLDEDFEVEDVSIDPKDED